MENEWIGIVTRWTEILHSYLGQNRGLSEAKMVAFFWWTSTNIIQIMIPGPQIPPLRGLSAFDRKIFKNLL